MPRLWRHVMYLGSCIIAAGLTLPALAQNPAADLQDALYARKKLERILADKPKAPQTTNPKLNIKDSAMAILVGEPALFERYGSEKVIAQRPYKVFMLDGYWAIMGSKPARHKKHPYLILIDASTGKVLGS